jgi:hypothetical protein
MTEGEHGGKMAILTENAILDGVNDFSLFGDQYTWWDGYRSAVDTWGGDGPDTKVFALTFAGSWTIQMLRISGDFALTNIVDLDDGGQREIELLRVGGMGGTVTLGATAVDIFRARSGDGNVTLNLGSGDVDTIALGGGDNRVSGGFGYIGSLSAGNGNDTVTLQGGADQISLGAGNNSITTGSAFVGAITMYSKPGDVNTITIGTGGVRSVGVSNGRDTVTLLDGAFVEQLNLGENNDRLTLRGTASINQADVGSGVNVVSVGAGNINALTAYSGNDTVTLTTGSVQSAALGGGNNVLRVGDGFVGTVIAYQGNDTLNVDSGRIQTLSLGDGNNRVTVGSGNIDSLSTYDGNDTVTIGSGRIKQLNLGGGKNALTIGVNGEVGSATFYDGNNTVTLAAGAQINQMIAGGGGGVNTVTLNGDSRILTLKMDGSNEAFADNTVTTGTGNIESFYSYKGNNTLNIGTGGIQQVVLSGDGGTHVVNATGFVGSLQVYDNANLTAVLNGGSISVFTGKGTDNVTLGAGQWLLSLIDWEGNDRVTLGTGSLLESANLSLGDDLVRLNTVMAEEVSQLRGGEGSDTLDLEQMTVGVSLSLGSGLQALGAGSILVLEFENLTGTALNDVLTGSDVGNVIRGGLGADTLFGLAGVDLLIGGAGNDSLTGGADADTFQFSPGGGRDRIADFAAGVDLIEFTAATSLANISITKLGTGVLLKVGTAEVVVENTTVAVMNDVDNFLF